MNQKEVILNQIRRLFSNTNQSREQTRRDLEEIRDEIDALIDALDE